MRPRSARRRWPREVAGRKVTVAVEGRPQKGHEEATGRQHGRMRRTRKRGGTKRSHVAEFAAQVTHAHKPATTFGSGVVRAFDPSDFLTSAYRQGLASRSAFSEPPAQSLAAAPRNPTTRTTGTAGSSAAHTSSGHASTGASHARTSTNSSDTSTIVGRNVSSASNQTGRFNANAYQEQIAQEMELRGQYKPGSAPGRGGDDTIISNAVLQTAAESAAEMTVSSAVLKGLGMAVQKLGYDGILDFVKRGVFGRFSRRSDEQVAESSSETEVGVGDTTPSMAARDEAAVDADKSKIQEETGGEGNGNADGNPPEAGEEGVVPETPAGGENPLAKINEESTEEASEEETAEMADGLGTDISSIPVEGTAEAVEGALKTLGEDVGEDVAEDVE